MHFVLGVTVCFSEFYPGPLSDKKLFPVLGVIILRRVDLSKLLYEALIRFVQASLDFI